jgi:hypothetical protein
LYDDGKIQSIRTPGEKRLFTTNGIQTWWHICLLLFQACSLYFEVDW